MADAPIFVVGCPRSGTTLLYHMLLSAGGFAHFRAETRAYNTLLPRFGDIARLSNRQRLVNHWVTTHHFRLTRLEEDWVRRTIMGRCHNMGGFLDTVMSEMARREGVRRWAECTPGHALHIPRILAELPGAKILHVIRDGRDVALSLERLGWIRPLPGDSNARLEAAAANWRWMVQKARRDGRRQPGCYREVRFEDLVQEPASTLESLAPFVDHDLDFDTIQRNAVGSVSRPNTAFQDAARRESPVGRWRSSLSPGQVERLEGVLQPVLEAVGYAPAEDGTRRPALSVGRALLYGAVFEVKHHLKAKTPMGRRFVSLDLLEDGLPLHADPRS